jgi:hypothetical protein
MAKPVKLRGERSIESKLSRLAYELEADAARIHADHPGHASLALSLKDISSRLGRLSRSLGSLEA